MSFWKRKDKLAIPAVDEPSSNNSSTKAGSIRSNSSLPSYKSHASTYVPSRDGDLYGNNSGYGDNKGYGGGNNGGNFNRSNSGGGGGGGGAPPSDPYASRDPYGRNKPISDAYSRGEANLSQDRAELFAGYTPSSGSGAGGAGGGSGRFFDGPQLSKQPVEGEEDDEDVEGIKTQTRFVKNESVNSTRNALRMAREAEETARGTLGRLGDQSEKLANTERHLDVSKAHSQRADDRTDELKQLNRSIFRPVITFNKDSKRAAQEAKIQARFEEERGERDRAMGDIRESQNRIGRAATYGRDVRDEGDDEEGIMANGGGRSMGTGRLRTAAQLDARKEQRKRYQFEQDEEDDRLEDELDDNLDEIGEMTKRLKMLGTAMGQELDNQNTRIERIEGKTTNLDGRIFRNTERLKKIK